MRFAKQTKLTSQFHEAAQEADLPTMKSLLDALKDMGCGEDELATLQAVILRTEEEQAEQRGDGAGLLTNVLSPAEAAEADKVICLADPDATVVSLPAGLGGAELPILGQHFHTLEHGQWLCDEIINAFIFLLLERDKVKCAAESNRKPVHLFNSFFFTKLLEPEGRNAYSHAAVKRWAKKVKRADGNIFHLAKLVIPVNINNVHWTCAAVDFEKKAIQYHDSMGGRGTEYVKALQRYLADEAAKFPDVQLDWEEWSLEYGSRTKDPQQDNGSDCGVFTCTFALCLCEDRPFSFSARDMAVVRKRLALAIQRGVLE